MKERLLSYLGDGPERVGIIKRDGEIVEFENVCSSPDGFQLKGDDLLLLESEDVVATWHTHPGASANLSVGDFHAFRAWPKLTHYIVGIDGVDEYIVRDGEVIVA